MRRGLVAEYETFEGLMAGIRLMRDAGYRALDAMSPYPSDEIGQALALPRSKLPWATGAGAVIGGCIAYLILWWTQVIDYPLNVGGRPDHAWPAFIPLTFETAILLGGVATFFSFFRFTGLPRLWHPSFEIPGVERASIDRFMLLVDAEDVGFDEGDARETLARAGALRVERFGWPPEARP